MVSLIKNKDIVVAHSKITGEHARPLPGTNPTTGRTRVQGASRALPNKQGIHTHIQTETPFRIPR